MSGLIGSSKIFVHRETCGTVMWIDAQIKPFRTLHKGLSAWWPLLGLLGWLVRERRNSSALAMELRLSCTNSSI